MTDPALLQGMNWRHWEAHVQGLLRFYGWRHFHAPANLPRDGRRGGGRQRLEPGFPDVVAIRRLRGHGPELVFAELKTGAGRLTRAQREWRDDLVGLGAAVEDLVARITAAAGGEAPARARSATLAAPAVAYYVWRPEDVVDVERILCGPHGVNVPVDRVAELAGGDVVAQEPELCHCGGVFALAGDGVVAMLRCSSCGRELPAAALPEEDPMGP